MLEALILGSLSVWRLTYMLQEESGPFAIFEKLRARIDRMSWKDGGIRDGFNCFYCLSVWIAILLVGLFLLSSWVFLTLTFILSISAVAIFVNKFHEEQ